MSERIYRYRIVNVFAESTFGGNPLCVFENGQGLRDEQMQLLARQFNLSETTFLLPVSEGSEIGAADASGAQQARVRIFTPGFEMPFAGHPTLGTAHVLRAMRSRSRFGMEMRVPQARVVLQMTAGLVPVLAEGDRWTLTAPSADSPRVEAMPAQCDVVAAALGLSADDLAGDPCWVDTGSQQLLVPLASADAVRRARPSGATEHWPASASGRRLMYAFAFDDGQPASRAAADPDRPRAVTSRFFFVANGATLEDPGTGSACANLGGWLLTVAGMSAGHYRIMQGEAIDRACRLELHIGVDGIQVGGRVVELGTGEIRLPEEEA